jgi:hypothetical protein
MTTKLIAEKATAQFARAVEKRLLELTRSIPRCARAAYSTPFWAGVASGASLCRFAGM